MDASIEAHTLTHSRAHSLAHSLAHQVQRFPSVAEYEAARANYCEDIVVREALVEDAITGVGWGWRVGVRVGVGPGPGLG